MKKPNVDTGRRALSTPMRVITALLCVAIILYVGYWAAAARWRNTSLPEVSQATTSALPRAPDFLDKSSPGAQSPRAETAASREARQLKEAFEKSENLADFVQQALAKRTPLSRFYAERAYDHCAAARTIVGGDKGLPRPLDRLRAREARRCDVLLQMFPDTAAFLRAVSYQEVAMEGAPSRDRSGSVLGQVDRRSREQRASDLALSMQIDDPNLIAQQMLAMLRADEVSLHGKRLTEHQRAQMANAVDVVRCDRGADCTLLRLVACQERSSACDVSVPMRQVLRDVFGQKDFAEIAAFADSLTAAIEARDPSQLSR